MRIDELKQLLDRTVTLAMKDGETVKARVTSVDDLSGEVVAAVEEASCPEDYRGACAQHTFAAEDIRSARPSE